MDEPDSQISAIALLMHDHEVVEPDIARASIEVIRNYRVEASTSDQEEALVIDRVIGFLNAPRGLSHTGNELQASVDCSRNHYARPDATRGRPFRGAGTNSDN